MITYVDVSKKDTQGFVRPRKGHPGSEVFVEALPGGMPSGLSKGQLDANESILEKPRDETLPKRKWPKKSLIKGKKTKLSIMTLHEDTLAKADKRYAECLKLADQYRKQRSREFMVSHGYVSSGVSSMLSTAALSLAASRYLYEKSAESGNLALLIPASKLSTDARQSELAAWELCAREAKARKVAEANMGGVPWLVQKQEAKRGRGRPRKDTEVTNAITSVYSVSDSEAITTTSTESSATESSGSDSGEQGGSGYL